MAQVENILLPMGAQIMERARMEAAISGQSVEAVLIAWVERGSALGENGASFPQNEYEVWSPFEEGNGISQIEALLQEDRRKHGESE